MPIPDPQVNETQQEYVARCHRFLATDKPNMPREQRHVICTNNWKEKKNSLFTRRLIINKSSSWKRLTNFLLIESAELLAPGIWTGEDGIPTKYSEDLIRSANQTILGKPIKITHGDKASTVVGFWDAYKPNSSKTIVQGIVWHPEGIKFFEEHPNVPLSVEAAAQCAYDPAQKIDVCLSMTYLGGAAVDFPASEGAGVKKQRTIALSKRNPDKVPPGTIIKKEKKKLTGEQWETPKLNEHEKTVLNGAFFDNKDIKLTRAEVLSTIKKQLEAQKVPEEQVNYIIAMLGKNITEAIASPDLPVKEVEKIVEKEVIKEVPIENDKKITDLEGQVTTLQGQLDTANSIIDTRNDTDITALGASIKAYDAEFEATKLLEGVSDKSIQKKMLENHLASLKRVKPNKIVLKLSKAEAKTKINKASKEMFGETFEKMLEDLNLGKEKP